MIQNVSDFSAAQTVPLRVAIDQVDRMGKGVLLLTDEQNVLVGLMTDGDLRRFLLKDGKLSDPVSAAMNREFLTWPANMGRETGLKFLNSNRLRHLPVVDEEGRPIDLLIREETQEIPCFENKIVIMAGGLGSRLRPFTEQCPKPMLEVDGKPMLEHIVLNFVAQGFSKFVFAVNYLGHIIEEHFQDGASLGVEIEYLREQDRLGTGGALSLIAEPPAVPFFVTNGDVLTQVDLGKMLHFHDLNQAVATIGVRNYDTQIPFGVVSIENGEVVSIDEKPIVSHQVNTGVYCLSPIVLSHLSTAEVIDMPNFLLRLKDERLPIAAFPIHESWIDVGRPDDLEAVRKVNPLR